LKSDESSEGKCSPGDLVNRSSWCNWGNLGISGQLRDQPGSLGSSVAGM